MLRGEGYNPSFKIIANQQKKTRQPSWSAMLGFEWEIPVQLGGSTKWNTTQQPTMYFSPPEIWWASWLCYLPRTAKSGMLNSYLKSVRAIDGGRRLIWCIRHFALKHQDRLLGSFQFYNSRYKVSQNPHTFFSGNHTKASHEKSALMNEQSKSARNGGYTYLPD